jgi:hypothetical protein
MALITWVGAAHPDLRRGRFRHRLSQILQIRLDEKDCHLCHWFLHQL